MKSKRVQSIWLPPHLIMVLLAVLVLSVPSASAQPSPIGFSQSAPYYSQPASIVSPMEAQPQDSVQPKTGRFRSAFSKMKSMFSIHRKPKEPKLKEPKSTDPYTKSKKRKIKLPKFGRFPKLRKSQKLSKRKARILTGHVQKEVHVTENEADLVTALVKCSPDADVVIHNRSLVDMQSGDVLVATKKKSTITVRSGGGSFVVGSGAIALISTRNGITKLRNLNEPRANNINAVIDGTSFPVRAGQEVVVADNFAELQNAVTTDAVNRRALNTFELPSGRHMMSCEFEPVTVIKQNEVLRSLIHTENKAEKVAFGKIMKMAACLQIATASHGSYLPIAQECAPETGANNHARSVGYYGSR